MAGITEARFKQLEALGRKHGLPVFTQAEVSAWQAAREARLRSVGPFTVLATGTDGCAEHIMQATLAYLREVTLGRVTFVEEPVGWEAMRRAGLSNPLDSFKARFPERTWRAAMASDAILFGAVGSKWDDPLKYGLPDIHPDLRPQKALMDIRFGLDLFANVRPADIPPSLRHLSPLRKEFLEGVGRVTVVRELTAGEYFQQPSSWEPAADTSVDTIRYTSEQIRRVQRVAFQLAREQGVSLTSFDKANVWATSRHWRKILAEVAAEYPDVRSASFHVDDGLQKLIGRLREFGVIVSSNLFGDIAGDVLGTLSVGSLGMLPSGGYGDGSWPNYFEPVHGSAIDIYPASGRIEDSSANPLATVLSAEMLTRSLGLTSLAQVILDAVNLTLERGLRTPDIYRGRLGETKVGTLGIMQALRENTLRLIEARRLS